jgi:predicted nucleic acid-binding Zn ribbon protein
MAIGEVNKCKKCGHVYGERQIIGHDASQWSRKLAVFEMPALCTKCGGDVVWMSADLQRGSDQFGSVMDNSRIRKVALSLLFLVIFGLLVAVAAKYYG